MLKNRNSLQNPSKLVVGVASVVGLSIMGDSLMYSLLPLEAESLGIPLVYVGLLLSINRIIRLLSNSWAGIVFEKFGAKIPLVFATLLAIVTTLIYGLGWGLIAFLLARAGWGISWSLLRQAGFASIWLAKHEIRGQLTGWLWSIVRLGSVISVVFGGYLYDNFGFFAAILGATAFAFISFIIAARLRWPAVQGLGSREAYDPGNSGWRKVIGEGQQFWLIVFGFMEAFFDSIVVSTASLFLASTLSNGMSFLGLSIGISAGLLLSVRFGADILFGPLIGSLSDRFGQKRTLSGLSLLAILGLSGIVFSEGLLAIIGLITVFIANAGLYVAGNTSASIEGEKSARPQLFVGLYSTAIDSGAAIGPIFVFSSAALLGSLGWIYMLLGLILFVVVQRYSWISYDMQIIN